MINIDFLNDLNALVGKIAWNVKNGEGSFITINFGENIKISNSFERGEWYLWLYFSKWVLNKSNDKIVSNNDNKILITQNITELNNKKVIKVNFNENSFVAEFIFEDDYKLVVLPSNDEEGEEWMLFTPKDMVWSVLSNKRVTIEKAS